MKFSLNFIKDFFIPPLSALEIAEQLTMAGLEVESFTKVGSDYIFDAEVTPNRCDWLSIFGIAAEISGLCNKPLKTKFPTLSAHFPLKEISIKVEDAKDCPLYIGQLIKGIRVDKPLPWLKERVAHCGINSINNVVDITNYCMLKWGNPLHVFDYDKIIGNIHIRRALDKESFLGLDNKEYTLSSHNLVISDDKKIIALAGILGAKASEVDFSTKNILLEAAIFNPLTIRRSRRAVGIDSAASYRFERGVSRELLDIAQLEAVRLMNTICQGTICGYYKVGRSAGHIVRKINFSLTELNGYIGRKFSSRKVKYILKNLGFKIEENDKQLFLCFVPFFRRDVKIKEDVFEEIARGYGYNRLPAALPSLIPQALADHRYIFKRELRNFLVQLGLNEVITYSVNNEDKLKYLRESNFIKLSNPLRKQENVLRTTLLAGMIEVVRYNLNQKNNRLRCFEIANTYHKVGKGFLELPVLGIITSGYGLSACGQLREEGFFYLKSVAQQIVKFLNINLETVNFLEGKQFNLLNVLEINYKNNRLGFLGKLPLKVKQYFGIKDNVHYLQLDIKTQIGRAHV